MQKIKTGIDIVKIDRIANIYKRYGAKFLDRICRPQEIDYIKSKNYRPETIASIYSFKESIAKAWGTGIGKQLSFKDIEISYDENGAPSAMVKDQDISISASHEGAYVITTALVCDSKISIDDHLYLLYRSKDHSDKTHKGSFGKVMVIASSKGMVGSGYLSSMAALRSGSGLVYHYVDPEDKILDILSIKHTEVILRDNNPIEDLSDMDAVLIGPGLGIKEKNIYLIKELLKDNINLIIDADGLNTIAKNPSILDQHKAQLILTPHIREFERLVGKNLERKDYFSQADKYAKDHNLILVLKDYHTYITNGNESYLLEKSNSALSTPGSGDVLAGIITSLAGQGYDIFTSAKLGVIIHSYAGLYSSLKNSKTSTIASDLIDSLKDVFKEVENGI